MSYFAYVTTLKNVRKHPNADRLQLAEVFGSTVCVSLDYTEGQLGVYFPTDGQLSVEFADANNLLRKKDAEGNNIGGYMDPDKRNVTAIKLRGEKSDGLFLPLSSLDYCYYTDYERKAIKEGIIDITEGTAALHLKEGDRIDVCNGHEICTKYIPRTQHRRGHVSAGNRTRKPKPSVAPTFREHADTEQLAYNHGAFKYGDQVEITLKMHGTSQRTGHLKVLKGYKRSFWDRLFRRAGTPIYDWDYITGTRRVVLDNFDGEKSFYGSNLFREQHHNTFVGKLWKGETAYYEVVGFTHTGASIMGSGNNEKLGKDFVKQYGKETVFSYGCSPVEPTPASELGMIVDAISGPAKPQSDIYVYRMTMTNEDGEVVEYTPDFMRYRCEQMGVKTVPVFDTFIIPEDRKKCTFKGTRRLATPGEYVTERAEMYYDGPDPIGKTHTREGVVVRVLNRPKYAAWKHKCFEFKVLEGILKADATAPDMEEAQDVAEV